MNIVKRIVKEVLLIPRNVVEGAVEAVDETVNGKPEKKAAK